MTHNFTDIVHGPPHPILSSGPPSFCPVVNALILLSRARAGQARYLRIELRQTTYLRALSLPRRKRRLEEVKWQAEEWGCSKKMTSPLCKRSVSSCHLHGPHDMSGYVTVVIWLPVCAMLSLNPPHVRMNVCLIPATTSHATRRALTPYPCLSSRPSPCVSNLRLLARTASERSTIPRAPVPARWPWSRRP